MPLITIETRGDEHEVQHFVGGTLVSQAWYSDRGEWSVRDCVSGSARQCYGRGAETCAREIAFEIAEEAAAEYVG